MSLSQFLPTTYSSWSNASAYATSVNADGSLIFDTTNDASKKASIEITAFNKYLKSKSLTFNLLGDGLVFADFLKYEESLTSGHFVIANQLVPKLAIYGGAGLILFLILKK